MSEDEMQALMGSLIYDPASGKLRWAQMLSRKCPPGSEAGTPNKQRHLVIQVNRKRYMAHRVAWLLHYGKPPTGVIDHINGDGMDNRISNLRDVSQQVNQQNRRSPQINSGSGLIGASLHKMTGKWMAQIKTPEGQKYLGLFPTAEAAHAAYVNAKRQLHEGCTI